MITELCEQATATPSLDAESALQVLADLWLEQGWRTGVVTSDMHDPELARLKYLGHVFCRAWSEIAINPADYRMAARIGGPLYDSQCWVRLPNDAKVHLRMCTSYCYGKNPADEPHECPYQSEINDDNDLEYCTCCSDCRRECLDNI